MSAESDRLVAALREAAEAVASAKVPAKLAEIAFAKSLDYLLGAPRPVPLDDGGGSQEQQRQRQRQQQPANHAGAIGKIAVKLGVGAEVVERSFEVEGDEVHLSVARRVLAGSNKGATRELAYLTAASRQAAEIEDHTATGTIKAVCDRFGVLDDPNFGRTMRELDGEGLRLSGSGHGRRFKINNVGYERASEIVKRIASEGSK
jgi:hypothetical protein